MLTNDEAKKALKHLAGLFPGQVTQEQAKWALRSSATSTTPTR
jgi:hypothetical protein